MSISIFQIETVLFCLMKNVKGKGKLNLRENGLNFEKLAISGHVTPEGD